MTLKNALSLQHNVSALGTGHGITTNIKSTT